METEHSNPQIHCGRLDKKSIDQLEAICSQLLTILGEDTNRDGLRDTPRRWAKWWKEFIDYDPGALSTSFETVEMDQVVLVRIPQVFSLCEHHLLPFSCRVAVGYLTKEKLLGLSKLVRVVMKHAHQLQIQERMAKGIADEVQELTESEHVAVLIEGTHLCTVMRGIKTDNEMVTSILRGDFRNDAMRSEFLALARKDR